MILSVEQVRQTLDSCKIKYSLMSLTDGFSLIITQHAGRIFAFDENGHSLYWMNARLAHAEDFVNYLHAKEWNMGGERIWIAPEIQYNIRDRHDFWNTHSIPTDIDPAHYRLSEDNNKVKLSQDMSLEAFNISSGIKNLSIERIIRKIDNPLRDLKQFTDLMSEVHYAGYEQTVQLTETNDTSIYSESWNLVQLEPDGMLYLPVTASPEVATYFGNPPQDAISADNHCVRLAITGTQQYKVGFKSLMMTGRMAYLKIREDESASLLIRNFDNNPSAFYSEEPPDEVGKRGFSVHIYNDDGNIGGFGEMECSGQAIGADTGRHSSQDTFRMWLFTGKNQALETIAELLLGIDL